MGTIILNKTELRILTEKKELFTLNEDGKVIKIKLV